MTSGTCAAASSHAHNPPMLKTLLAIHVAGGSVALASMLMPLFSRKGGSLHRKAGWVFVGGMTLVSMTAFILAGARALTDPRPQGAAGRRVPALRRDADRRRRVGRHPGAAHQEPHDRPSHWWDVGRRDGADRRQPGDAGLRPGTRQTLFVAFSFIGIVNGVSQLEYWLRPPTHPMHWWFEHMGACSARASPRRRRSWSSTPAGWGSTRSRSRSGSHPPSSACRRSRSGRGTTAEVRAARQPRAVFQIWPDDHRSVIHSVWGRVGCRSGAPLCAATPAISGMPPAQQVWIASRGTPSVVARPHQPR